MPVPVVHGGQSSAKRTQIVLFLVSEFSECWQDVAASGFSGWERCAALARTEES